MIKIILLLCIVCIPAHAVEVQRTNTGIVFMIQTTTGKHCWGLQQNFDLSKFPTTAMDIEQVAKQYNWPNPAGDQQVACDALTKIVWTVQPYIRNGKSYPRNVYQIDVAGNKTDTKIDKVNSGTMCGNFVQAYSATITTLEWRMVTGNAGKHGAAVCEKTN